MFDNINDYARGFSHEYMTYGEDMFIENEVLKNITIDTIRQVEDVIKASDTIVEVIARKES